MNDDLSRQMGRSLLARTLSDPHAALGRIEGNVEAKALGPALAMLGWDLVGQVHWQFQLRSTPTALSADAVIGDAQGVWAVCETKALGALTQAADGQVLGYRDALGAPLALLTDGLRWRLWGAVDTTPLVTCDAVDTEQLLAVLAPHLDADTASASAWKSPEVWEYGRGVAGTRAADLPTPSWDPSTYSDPQVSAVVRGLSAIATRYPGIVTRDASSNRLYLRLHHPLRTVTLVEYAPPGKIVRRRDASALGVPLALLDAWFTASAQIDDPDVIPVAMATLAAVVDAAMP